MGPRNQGRHRHLGNGRGGFGLQGSRPGRLPGCAGLPPCFRFTGKAAIGPRRPLGSRFERGRIFTKREGQYLDGRGSSPGPFSRIFPALTGTPWPGFRLAENLQIWRLHRLTRNRGCPVASNANHRTQCSVDSVVAMSPSSPSRRGRGDGATHREASEICDRASFYGTRIRLNDY